MRLTRFRVASMIAILSCSAAWAASLRAQTGAQQSSSVALSLVAEPARPPVSRQVRELSAPPGATPSPGRPKQVIDLRSRATSAPPAVPARAVTTGQQSPTSPTAPTWVDSAIPLELLDQAQSAPRSQPSPAGPGVSVLTPPASAAPESAVTPPSESAVTPPSIVPLPSTATSPFAIPLIPPSNAVNPSASAASPLANGAELDRPEIDASKQPPAGGLMILQPSKLPQNIAETNPPRTPVQVEQLPSPKPTSPSAGTNAGQAVTGLGPRGSSQPTVTPGRTIPDWLYSRNRSIPSPDASLLDSPAQGQLQIPPSGLEQPQASNRDPADKPLDSQQGGTKANHLPEFSVGAKHSSESDLLASQVDYCPGDFSSGSGPIGSTFDPFAAAHVYRGKFAITTQRPLVELWRPQYTPGVFPQAPTWFGVTNPMKPHFLVYGDMRTVLGVNHNDKGKSNVWGNVLNLDMDLQLTSTERIHAFVSPLNRGTRASGVSFNDELDLINGTNFDFNTLFFEGDAGALLGGARGTYPPFDLPFTFGLIPLVYQNGIWANDNVLGAAVSLPARHSRALQWSNFDATLFWAADNVTSDAFPNQDSAADFFGTAWFIDAYEGYIEANYAFVNDNTGAGRGYHNISMAFTRRYLHKLSNSVRLIVNAGQEDLPLADRTADGHLLLIENSLISAHPNTVVPYFNLFYGQGRPQSLARIGIAGGILTNTGINFETDGITGYPTLDATGSNTFGFASGINLMGSQFSHQLILEFAMLQAVGSRQLRNAAGDEYGLGLRYQKPLSHNLIFRTDHMVGFRDEATNITGSRFELRWKF